MKLYQGTAFWSLFQLGVAAAIMPARAISADLPVVDSPRQPVTDQYHGVSVTDDYQWLENAGSPPVREWTQKENERTRSFFNGLNYCEGIAKQLMALRSEESARYSELTERHGRIFGLRFKPPAQQPVLVCFSSLESTAPPQTVFDPNLYNT